MRETDMAVDHVALTMLSAGPESVDNGDPNLFEDSTAEFALVFGKCCVGVLV